MKTDGLLLIHKVSGPTSHDLVEEVRKLYHMRKVGHTGTLDPQAEGLMVLCLGKASRLQQFLTGMDKTYRGSIYFGFATTTYDAQGDPVGEEKAITLDLTTLNALAKKYIGEIRQVSPPYSAKRYKGKRLYELAREGQPTPELPKKVIIHAFAFEKIEGKLAWFYIHCGSGTYIRSLAHEIGQELGCGAHLKSLCRLSLGNFQGKDAISLENLKKNKAILHHPPHFIPLHDIQLPFQQIQLDNIQIKKLLQGRSIQHYDLDFSLSPREGLIQVNSPKNRFVCVARYEKKSGNLLHIHPKVVVATQEELSMI